MLAAAVCPAGEKYFATAGLAAAIEDNIYRTSSKESATGARLSAGAGRRFEAGASGEGRVYYNGSIFYVPSIGDLNLTVHELGFGVDRPLGDSLKMHAGAQAGFRRGSASYRELDYSQLQVSGGLGYQRASGLEFGLDYALRARDYSRTGPGYTAHEPAVSAAGTLGQARWRLDVEFGYKSLESGVVETDPPMMGNQGHHHHGGGFGMTPRVQTVPQPSVQRAALTVTGSRPLGRSTGLRVVASVSRILKGVSPYFPGLDPLQNAYSFERFDDYYSFDGWTIEGRITRVLPMDSTLRLQGNYRRLSYPGRPTLDAQGQPTEPFTERLDRESVLTVRLSKAITGITHVERLALTASFTYYRNASNDGYFRASDRLWLLGFELGL